MSLTKRFSQGRAKDPWVPEPTDLAAYRRQAMGSRIVLQFQDTLSFSVTNSVTTASLTIFDLGTIATPEVTAVETDGRGPLIIESVVMHIMGVTSGGSNALAAPDVSAFGFGIAAASTYTKATEKFGTSRSSASDPMPSTTAVWTDSGSAWARDTVFATGTLANTGIYHFTSVTGATVNHTYDTTDGSVYLADDGDYSLGAYLTGSRASGTGNISFRANIMLIGTILPTLKDFSI